jgi:hypothetical protein
LVNLRSNTCVKSKISQSYGKLSSAIISQNLEKCYKNYYSEFGAEIIKNLEDECSGKPMVLIIIGIQIILFIFSVVIFVTFYGINRKFAGLKSEK